MEVVEREARARGRSGRAGSRRTSGRAPARRGLRPVRPVAASRACSRWALVGFGVAQLGGGDEGRARSRPASTTAALPEASGRLTVHGDGEDGASCACTGMPAPGAIASTRHGCSETAMIVPQPTFEVGADGGGAVAVPEDVSGAKAVLVTREPRGGVARAEREADSDGAALAAARFVPGGDLLPPSRTGRPGSVLELRAPDLPGLHDVDVGRDALPRVREPAHAVRTMRRPRRAASRCSPTS